MEDAQITAKAHVLRSRDHNKLSIVEVRLSLVTAVTILVTIHIPEILHHR